MAGLFARIRAASAEVAARARYVSIADAPLSTLADELAAAAAAPAAPDPAHRSLGSEEETLAFVIALDAVNFGSGWFPHLRKRPGRSGYFTIAEGLREHFERAGALDADALARATPEGCAAIFGQDAGDPVAGELMALFARAWRDLAALLHRRHGGSFRALVDGARCSAARLVEALAEMPLYRDVARYDELEVPFYKRAQITCADLAQAFAGAGPGHFDDLDALTLFADNLVPHVLRMEGVLIYEPALLSRIDAGALIPSGSAEEVEIRACALHAVERMCARLRERGTEAPAHRLDGLLWQRGQSPAMKAVPRHRTRCVYY